MKYDSDNSSVYVKIYKYKIRKTIMHFQHFLIEMTETFYVKFWNNSVTTMENIIQTGYNQTGLNIPIHLWTTAYDTKYCDFQNA